MTNPTPPFFLSSNQTWQLVAAAAFATTFRHASGAGMLHKREAKGEGSVMNNETAKYEKILDMIKSFEANMAANCSDVLQQYNAINKALDETYPINSNGTSKNTTLSGEQGGHLPPGTLSTEDETAGNNIQSAKNKGKGHKK